MIDISASNKSCSTDVRSFVVVMFVCRGVTVEGQTAYKPLPI